jgi:phosphate ABC transporter permease subunit PstA
MSATDAKKVTAAQRSQKAQQGVFFISLSLGALGIICLMLLSVLGYMLVRGSSRLFYSPVYNLRFADGSTMTTNLNENVEFDELDGATRNTRGALQAGKYYLNMRVEALKYSQAPVPEGILVEVWKDVTEEVADPWATEGEAAAKIKRVVQKKVESISGVRDIRFDPLQNLSLLTMTDGKERRIQGKINLQFRQGEALFNFRTLVTRYLQDNPNVAKERDALIAAELAKATGGGFTIDRGWKAYLTGYSLETKPDGSTYQKEQRIKELPPVASLSVSDRWNWFQFFWDSPRSGNTEGGVFPCIFGTVLMTLIMTFVVAPFGIATAVYLKEYARDTWYTRAIRMAVANLAGVPSIVFGLFGLGFFVLTIGGGIDRVFFHGETTFGTPCVLWASTTMALLTLPVMIVATEEALRTVPRELREGALALGATKLATITTVVLPAAAPGILTGVILAVARGSGEVAPLLLTGVIAQKDQLPMGVLEKFMNLAYHIYDLAVKSQPNKIEEAQALAFSAALVLILVVLCMNLAAILLRARLGRLRSV